MILTPFLVSFCSPTTATEPHGRYVEARTASVFAGACHYGGERTTAGREALLVWSIDAGTFRGVDLSGTCVAAAVVDKANLADEPSERRAVVYVPGSATGAQREALAAWIDERAGETLGAVRAVKTVDMSVSIGPESYIATAPGVFNLRGDALPNRACCKMPFQVWYDPFVALDGQLVGRDLEFCFSERDLARTWSRPGENAAFFGRFGPPTSVRSVARAH